MSTGNPKFDAAPIHHKPLEQLKQDFQKRLDTILKEPLTIKNIEAFADDALDKAVLLSTDILKEYRTNPKLHASPNTWSDSEQEDAACEILDLPNINEILDSIKEVKAQIDSLKNYINENVIQTDKVNTPPQSGQAVEIVPSDGSFKEKEILPRLLVLLYILKHDFKIEPSKETGNMPVKMGIVTDKMMRKTPYARVEIPELNRVVYICDEEGNRTFVFDTLKVAEVNLLLDEIDLYEKKDKDYLIARYPGIGIAFRQSLTWRARIAEALQNEIPQIKIEIPDIDKRVDLEKIKTSTKKIPSVEKSEFDPWRAFWTDPETQKHWASLSVLVRKFRISHWDTIAAYAKKNNLKYLDVHDLAGNITKAYCYEDFMDIDAFMDFLTAPEVNTEGEWLGFYTDPEGRHWAPVSVLSPQLRNISGHTIDAFAKKIGFKCKRIKTLTGGVQDSFCLEELVGNSEFSEFINLPTAANEGEWRGFHTDENGGHWGSSFAIANKLQINRPKISTLIAKLKSKKMKNGVSKPVRGFCIEDVQKELNQD